MSDTLDLYIIIYTLVYLQRDYYRNGESEGVSG